MSSNNRLTIKPLLSAQSFNDAINTKNNISHISMNNIPAQLQDLQELRHLQKKIALQQSGDKSFGDFFTRILDNKTITTTVVFNVVGLLVIIGIIIFLYHRHKEKDKHPDAVAEFLMNAQKINEQIAQENQEKMEIYREIEQQKHEKQQQRLAEQIDETYNKLPQNATDDVINNILNNNRANNNNMDKYDNTVYRDYLKTNNSDMKKNNPIFHNNNLSNTVILDNKHATIDINKARNPHIINEGSNRLINISTQSPIPTQHPMPIQSHQTSVSMSNYM